MKREHLTWFLLFHQVQTTSVRVSFLFLLAEVIMLPNDTNGGMEKIKI